MAAPYSAKAIANMFIEKASQEGVKGLTPMKLQKLVYYAHGWYLAFTDTPLIKDEIEAWEFGPVVTDLYHEFKSFGNSDIRSKAHDLDFKDGTFKSSTPEVSPDDEATNAVINEVWRVYGRYSSIQLSNMTHDPGTPWDLVNSQFRGNLPSHQQIPNELIKEKFQEKLKASGGDE